MITTRLLLPLLLTFTAVTSQAAPPAEYDVRVLIDVSGSMRQNDPQNLRAPALRLLVNLLPPGSAAGVWIFAEGAETLVPFGAAGEDWRQRALAGSQRIHSRGQLTDIGAGLEAATHDWQASPASHKRILILLTDGMVDVSKQLGANEAARQHILDRLLPELRAEHAELHTLALSDKADADLLRALATGTDGSFEQADDAGKLERLFLRLFERSVPRDTLPLVGNRFQVDGSVEELTLLAFRKPDGAEPRLRTPSGKEFGATAAPAGVRWHSEPGYDLVTVDQPEPGEWRLVGDSDPDNRVMVLTRLKLRTSELPDNVFVGEQLPLQVQLSENGQTITRQELLQLVDIEVEQNANGRPPRHWQLADNGVGDDANAADGVYSANLGANLAEGDWELVVRARSPTFVRERRQRLSAFASPLATTLEMPDGQNGTHRLRLTQTVDWVDAESLRIGGRLTSADGGVSQLSVPHSGDGAWQLDLPGLDPQAAHRIALDVAGRTLSGRDFKLSLPPLTVQPIAAAPQAAPPEPPPVAELRVNWLAVGIVLVTGNVALFGIGGLGLYFYRKRQRPIPGISGIETAAEGSQ